MRIRILIIVKVVKILDHMSVEPQNHFEPPGLVHGLPRLYFLPIKRVNFDFNADPNSAFHYKADTDPASENNAIFRR
jgi:hypothetical protein